MTVTLNLSAETTRKLEELAARAGQSLERLVEDLVDERARRTNGVPTASASSTWEDVCAPIAAALQESTLTDEQLADWIEEARQEVWQEQHTQQDKRA